MSKENSTGFSTNLKDLISKTGGTPTTIAKALNVSIDLVYAWQEEKVRPSVRTALALGKLESRTCGTELVPTCLKWLKHSRHGRLMTPEEVKRSLNAPYSIEDIPGLSDTVSEAIAPLAIMPGLLRDLTCNQNALTTLVTCKMSIITACAIMEDWIGRGMNSNGTTVLICHISSGRTEKFMDIANCLGLSGGKSQVSKPRLIGCLVSNDGITPSSKAQADIQKKLPGTELFWRDLPELLQNDYWLFNSRYERGTRELKVFSLVDTNIAWSMLGADVSGHLKERAWEFSTIATELDIPTLEKVLEHYTIRFQEGELRPVLETSGWKKL